MTVDLQVLERIRAECLQLRRRVQQQHIALTQAKAQAAFWQTQAIAMRDSTSWRLTAGLRKVVGWLKGSPRQVTAVSSALPSAPRTAVSVHVTWVVGPDDTATDLQRVLHDLLAQTHADWTVTLLPVSVPASANDARLATIKAALIEAGRITASPSSGAVLNVMLDGVAWLAPQALQALVAEAVALHPAVWPARLVLYADHELCGASPVAWHKPEWSPVLACEADLVGPVLAWLGADPLVPLPQQANDTSALGAALLASLGNAHMARVPQSLSGAMTLTPERRLRQRHAIEQFMQARYPEVFERLENDGPQSAVLARPRFRHALSKATLIIPTRDRADLLQDCVRSILDHSAGMDYEILVIDNGSVEPQTKALFDTWATNPQIRVLSADCPFNWSYLNNLGRREARGDLLVFLNNDTLVRQAGWLGRLAEWAALPDVGVVGPLLLYPDDTVQHAGVVVGLGGWADHVYKGLSPTAEPGVYGTPAWSRNVLAVTGACLAITTARFDELGGFDEAFIICGSDVEIGLRAYRQGLWNVYLADVSLYHLESKTRSPHVPEVDFQQSAIKYAPYREQGDPFYHPGLSLHHCVPSTREAAP